jgi:hypothetical protein
MENLYFNIDVGTRERVVQIDFVVLDRARSKELALGVHFVSKITLI